MKLTDKQILRRLKVANELLREVVFQDLSTDKNYIRLIRMSIGHIKQAIKEFEEKCKKEK